MKRSARARTFAAPNRLASAIDSLAATFSPKWHTNRLRCRAVSSAVTALAPYRGAENSRLRADWNASDGSADQDTLFAADVLRERTRDLVRNDGVAAGMLGTIVRNTVGTGIRPQSRVDADALKLTPEQSREFQKTAEGVFRRWMPFADARHEQDFFGLQRLTARSYGENGDTFLVIRSLALDGSDGRARPFSTAVELVEADRCSTPGGFPTAKNDANGNEIRGGVERNADGQAVAYWFLKRHPGDYGLASFSSRQPSDYFRVPKYDENGIRRVVHLMNPLRIGQSRGISSFAAVLDSYKDLGDVMEAERVAQRIAACFGLIIKSANPFGDADGNSSGTNSAGQTLESIEPGMIEYTTGDITQVNPNRPGTNFDPFIMRVMRIIGAGQGIPYEATSMDYSQVNFASGRCARIDARTTFLIDQRILSQAWQAIYDAVIEEAFTLGMLPSFTRFNYAQNRDLYHRCEWIGPGYGYVQPDKEIQAARDGIQLGVTTLAAEAAQNGTDWMENIDQLAIEDEYRIEKGLPSMFSIGQPAAKPGEEVDDDEAHKPEPKKKAPMRARA